MAVINDNGPEESWDTGATYIIPSHQSMHLCGLFSANQHTTVKKKKKKFPSPECDQSCGHSVMHVSREALRFLPVLFYAVCHERPTKSSAHCEDSVLNRWQMIPQSNSLVTVTRRFKCSKISEPRFGLARKSLLHELFITVVCRPGLGFRLHAGTY